MLSVTFWTLISGCALLCNAHPLPDIKIEPCQISRRATTFNLNQDCDGHPIPGVIQVLNLIPFTEGATIQQGRFNTFILDAIANARADATQHGGDTEIIGQKFEIKKWGLHFFLEHDKYAESPFDYGLIVTVLELLQANFPEQGYKESTLIVLDSVVGEQRETVNAKGLLKVAS